MGAPLFLMKKNRIAAAWAKAMRRSWSTLAAKAVPRKTLKPRLRKIKTPKARPSAAAGSFTWGMAAGPGGARRYRVYRPPGLALGERVPLLVMLHGCGQDAASFAASTRMNSHAARQRFVVLYPEQDRLSNAQACWNWFDTANGRAEREADLIMLAINQVVVLHAIDSQRVAIAGLSAGASMAGLLVTRHPSRFKALVMHSGVPPGTAHSSLTALSAMRGRRASQPLASSSQTMIQSWPALLVIQGGADAVVSPHNGQAAAHLWANAAGADAGPTRVVQRGQRYPMTVTDFKHSQQLVCRLVEIAALAHAWSGGAASQAFSDPRGPDASRLVWAFATSQFED